tara:strand:- start:451 stop:1404 length:954 start_codon:yes stop_codon:yes gene_type:complete
MADPFAPQEAVTGQTPEVPQPEALTPELAFDQTQDKATLVEEFFRANKMDETPSETELEPSPVEIPSDEVTAEPAIDNDVKRYQYWQSEADKARNENVELKQALNSQAPAPQPEPENQVPEQVFPDPPPKPSKPRNFSRGDAMDDTQSESATYLDDVDNWRDDMDEYNRLHQQYSQAVVQEEREALTQEREDIQRNIADKEVYDTNMSNMATHLQQQYSASPEEIKQFVSVMDDPKNITVDNLFQLYRLQNGGTPEGVPSQPGTQTASSESFEQLKRAQQVPSPMGVVTGATSAQTGGSDSIFDSMVTDYKSRNPFS